MDADALASLRSLAEAATRGPWTISEVWSSSAGDHWSVDDRNGDDGIADQVWEYADAAYIAAVDPSTVLALLDEMEALRAERDALKDAHATAVAAVNGLLDEVRRLRGEG